jgi:hypothetical protein
MTPSQILGFLLGTAFASGLNLYATVAALGLLHRYQLITLPEGLQVLAHPWVLGIAIVLYCVEFVADKVPWLDSVWDVVHTFIRPPAAALLAYATVGSVAEPWRLAAGLIAGSVALTSHTAKASTRAAANTSPEPFSNWALSLAEDGIAITLVWLATTHPILTAFIVAGLGALAIFIIIKLFGILWRALRRVFGRAATPISTTPVPPVRT